MNKEFKFKIILGSASPRRQELLKSLNFDFNVYPINADETFPKNLIAEEIPLYLSEKKSLAYQQPLSENEVLITSDTIVWHNGIALNKPSSYEEAKLMLSSLSGEMHEVFTGVCLRSLNWKKSFVEVTKVYFKNLSDSEIDFYLKNYNAYDKAGAYGAQDWIGLIAVERIEGSYFNVMGLPVHRLYSELQKINT